MQLIYKGSDIYKQVSVNKCIVDLHSECRCDSLTICFNDTKGLWSKWNVRTDDEITFSHDQVKTGRMYICEQKGLNGLYSITARSAPKSFWTGEFKSWDTVKFSQFASEIAQRHGMTYSGYDVSDRIYTFLSQKGEPDSRFLQHRCQLEGYAMIVRDGRIIVYDERTLEKAAPSDTLKIGIDGVYNYKTSSIYSTCEVISGQYRGSFSITNGKGIYRPDYQIQVNSNEEAARFSKNLLRLSNKNSVSGCIRRKLTTEYTAGTVIKIESAKTSMWDGKAVLTRVRHDFLHNETKIWFRRPLEGY